MREGGWFAIAATTRQRVPDFTGSGFLQITRTYYSTVM
jgi:hypothetical protein